MQSFIIFIHIRLCIKVCHIFLNSFHLLNLNIGLNRQLCINTCFMYFKNVWLENLCFGVLYFCSEHIILKDENF